MIARLMNIIKEVMPDANVESANESSRLFEDLGFDSIGMMMLAMALEDEFGVHFTEAVRFVTVADVIKFLEANGK